MRVPHARDTRMPCSRPKARPPLHLGRPARVSTVTTPNRSGPLLRLLLFGRGRLGLRRLLGGDLRRLLLVHVVSLRLFLRGLFLCGFRGFVAHGGFSFRGLSRLRNVRFPEGVTPCRRFPPRPQASSARKSAGAEIRSDSRPPRLADRSKFPAACEAILSYRATTPGRSICAPCRATDRGRAFFWPASCRRAPRPIPAPPYPLSHDTPPPWRGASAHAQERDLIRLRHAGGRPRSPTGKCQRTERLAHLAPPACARTFTFIRACPPWAWRRRVHLWSHGLTSAAPLVRRAPIFLFF